MTLPPLGSLIHLIGIGGAGMSAIARVLLGMGYRVTGSERLRSDIIAWLVYEGAAVIIGHDAINVIGAQAVIVTSAAANDHVEVVAARAAGIPVYKRSDILADLTAGKRVIAVAGAAGKTTTTVMIAHMLMALGRDPSYIIGGVLPKTGKNGGVGKGQEFVIEADEYDNMFLGLAPDIAIITNIVWDHPDFFPTEADMIASFRRFADRITARGTLIVTGGDRHARALSDSFGAGQPNAKSQFSLRVSSAAQDEVRIMEVRAEPDVTHFRLRLNADDEPLSVQLAIPGTHNIFNAANALTALSILGITDFAPALAALATFKGTARRFELMGEVGGVAVIDDYAHHPIKIRAVLQAARSRYPGRAIWVVWQPHTFSRTQALWEDFASAFDDCDHVLVTPVYAAREEAIPGIDGISIAGALRHSDARFVPSFDNAVSMLLRGVEAPAAILILSAGDAPQIGRAYLKQRSAIS